MTSINRFTETHHVRRYGPGVNDWRIVANVATNDRPCEWPDYALPRSEANNMRAVSKLLRSNGALEDADQIDEVLRKFSGGMHARTNAVGITASDQASIEKGRLERDYNNEVIKKIAAAGDRMAKTQMGVV